VIEAAQLETWSSSLRSSRADCVTRDEWRANAAGAARDPTA